MLDIGHALIEKVSELKQKELKANEIKQ